MTPTDKSAQLEAAKLAAKLKEEQGVFRASVEASSDGVINPATPATQENSTGNDGVSAPVIRDAKTGRWLPGVSPNPLGRPSAKREKAIINAINAAVQPETVADVILGLLTHPHSWRANAAGAEWYGKYMLGPAPQRQQEQENVLDAILVKLRSVHGGKDESE